jgi:hypothetical protein
MVSRSNSGFHFKIVFARLGSQYDCRQRNGTENQRSNGHGGKRPAGGDGRKRKSKSMHGVEALAKAFLCGPCPCPLTLAGSPARRGTDSASIFLPDARSTAARTSFDITSRDL